jgi:hypothetical protein
MPHIVQALSPRPFCPGCIISTRGYDFRKGHPCKGSLKHPYRKIPGYFPEEKQARRAERAHAQSQNKQV